MSCPSHLRGARSPQLQQRPGGKQANISPMLAVMGYGPQPVSQHAPHALCGGSVADHAAGARRTSRELWTEPSTRRVRLCVCLSVRLSVPLCVVLSLSLSLSEPLALADQRLAARAAGGPWGWADPAAAEGGRHHRGPPQQRWPQPQQEMVSAALRCALRRLCLQREGASLHAAAAGETAYVANTAAALAAAHLDRCWRRRHPGAASPPHAADSHADHSGGSDGRRSCHGGRSFAARVSLPLRAVPPRPRQRCVCLSV